MFQETDLQVHEPSNSFAQYQHLLVEVITLTVSLQAKRNLHTLSPRTTFFKKHWTASVR